MDIPTTNNFDGFSAVELDEVRLVTHSAVESSLGERIDLRGKNIFTMTKTASDTADTAYSIKKTNGGFICAQHIADVAHYIKAGSALDCAAKARGRTIDSGVVALPMLPSAVTDTVCNLADGKSKLTFTITAEFTADGSPVACEFSESLTAVKFNAVFSEIDVIYTDSDNSALLPLRNRYSVIKDEIANMYELAAILRRKRRDNGEAIFDIYGNVMAKCGDLYAPILAAAPDSYMMAEEISLAVRQMVAQKLQNDGCAAVYAYRTQPADIGGMTLNQLAALANTSVASRELCLLAANSIDYPHFSTQPTPDALTGAVTLPMLAPTQAYSGLVALRALKSAYNSNKFDAQLPVLNQTERLAYQREVDMKREAQACYLNANIQQPFAGRAVYTTDEGTYIVLENGIIGVLEGEKLQMAQEVQVFVQAASCRSTKITFRL